ncbi:hypothetical protein MRX96_034625 [Rhipicephalus microplus]
MLGVVGGYMGFWMELSTLKVLWRLIMVLQGCLASANGRLGPLARARVRFISWLVLVVVAGACTLVCLASSVWDVRSYMQYRTTVQFEQQPLSGIAFPAMTVCNENGWRLTYTSNWKAMCFTFHLSAQNEGNYSRFYWSCSEPWKYRLEVSLAVQRERSDEEEEVAPLSALLHEQGLFTAGMLNPFIFTYGESYLISAFQEEVLSLPSPYETMCSKYDSKSGEYSYADGVVQSEECSSKCIADHWQQHCSCFSKLYSVKHRRHGPICEYIDHLRCTDKMKRQLWLPSCQSACTRPCPMEDLMIYIGGHVDMWLGFALIGVCGAILDLAVKCSKWFSRNTLSVELLVEPPYKNADRDSIEKKGELSIFHLGVSE